MQARDGSRERNDAHGRRAQATLAALAGAIGALVGTSIATGVHAGGLPPGFEVTEVASGFDRPVDVTFAADGRMFITEQRGVVWVMEDGKVLAEPFIDLTEEITGAWDRGLLGIALHPDFLNNRKVYLLYTVDVIFGEPDEDPFLGTFCRLTSYVGTKESNGNLADLDSRCVMIGETAREGIPTCEPSHSIGYVRFGNDGTLLVSAGDGAHFNSIDFGGQDPECFGPDGFGKDEDIGAFRAQYLGSLAGKILRIDPDTGHGLPANPYWTGDGTDKQSKVWVSGLRNPYRFEVRPDPGPGPGALFIGDVGWNEFEEVEVAYGGENFGWPCYEGLDPHPVYGQVAPAHSGCDSIGTEENPGPLTAPIVSWHHFFPDDSTPPGFASRCVIGGTFYTGTSYPEFYRGGYFCLAYTLHKIRYFEINAQNELIGIHEFAAAINHPTDLETHPDTGDLYVVNLHLGKIQKISFLACPGDLNGDLEVTFEDLLLLLGTWGPCKGCPEDLDGDGVVRFDDLLILLANWGACPSS